MMIYSRQCRGRVVLGVKYEIHGVEKGVGSGSSGARARGRIGFGCRGYPLAWKRLAFSDVSSWRVGAGGRM